MPQNETTKHKAVSQHEWVKSTLGHGETMCKHCFMTNREAAVLDMLNECPNVQNVETGDQKKFL